MESIQETFNRTIVELKRGLPPLPNLLLHPFNRTIVELKRRRSCQYPCSSSLLIEPLWN